MGFRINPSQHTSTNFKDNTQTTNLFTTLNTFGITNTIDNLTNTYLIPLTHWDNQQWHYRYLLHIWLHNNNVIKTNSISLSWDSWNVMSVNIPVACDHFAKWNADHTGTSEIYSQPKQQPTLLSPTEQFCSRDNIFLLAYITGCFTRSYSCIMHAHRLLLDASVDNMISQFKSGNFRIRSDDSIFLTSLNALSRSEPHSTLFGALFIVNSVKAAITSAQLNVCMYVSTIKIYHSKQAPTRFLCFGLFSVQDSPHRFILRFYAISL